MDNVRKYGAAPYAVAVIHGGPGATGQMAAVAKKLSALHGVLEPLQTATSVVGQVNELRDILQTEGTPPVTLIGFSWGAWLGFITAALHPTLVKKLILVSSAPFEAHYAEDIMKTRISRLSDDELSRLTILMDTLVEGSAEDMNGIMAQFGELVMTADSFTPPLQEEVIVEYHHDIYRAVWPEANKLRSKGQLLELGKQIACPVIAIHGDYDPHPIEGVEEPLSRVVQDFTLKSLRDCGHYPWREQFAREKFFEILEQEL